MTEMNFADINDDILTNHHRSNERENDALVLFSRLLKRRVRSRL